MATGSSLFGWNLLYNSVEQDIKTNEDVLLCLTHLVLISNGFQCIGLGDSKNMDGTEPKTETLPAGWNDAYALRYVHQGRLYNLQGTRLDDGVMINLIRADERNVSLVQLNSRSVATRTGTIDEMIPNNKDVVAMIKAQLIDKVTTSTKTKEGGSQTVGQSQSSRWDSPSRQSMPDFNFPRRFPLQPNPLGVGHHDLDPLAGITGPFNPLGGFGPVPPAGTGFHPIPPGGGGMLFQPPMPTDPQRTGVPQGSLPPGARFDPFRPPETDRYQPPRRPNPDNDELRPPGFDDMYM